MEQVDQWDDEEKLLAIVENNERTPPVTEETDPFGPEMVAVPDDGDPAEGSTTPRPAAAPDPTARTPERDSTAGDDAERVDVCNGFSFKAIHTALDSMLAAAGNMEPPDVNSSQNLWGNFNLGPSPDGSLTPANSMLAPILTTLSEQERSKIVTDLIINCIQQQRVLWDSTHPKFGDSKLCQLVWSNIASVCGYHVKKLKSRWYALKNTFKKEYLKSSSTGVTSKSPNFAAMSFLEVEIQRELQRANNEKKFVMQQLLRLSGGTEPRGATESSVEPHDVDEGPMDPSDDDCVIVDSDQEDPLPCENPLPPRTKDTGHSSSRAAAPGSSTSSSKEFELGIRTAFRTALEPIKGIKPRDISELQKKRPQGSNSIQGPAHVSEHPVSPEVICLGEPKEPQIIMKQYTPVPGKPIIKYCPAANQPAQRCKMKLEVEEAMPKDLTTIKTDLESQAPPAVTQQLARKSISRANLTLFPRQNGARNSSAPLNLSKKTENAVPCKIESRSTEAARTSVKREEPALQKRLKQSTEPARSELSKQSQQTASKVRHPNPEPTEDDEIQIIREVPRPSEPKRTTDQPPSERRMRKTSQGQPKNQRTSVEAESSPDETAPPKKPRIAVKSEPGPSSQAAQKRKVDKDRENSANEHFLLSLLCEIETMNSEQFRRFKKHSTALASMILEPR